MTAKEYLLQYRECVDDIRARNDEYRQLILDIKGIPGRTDEIQAFKAEIEREKSEMLSLRREIRGTIRQISERRLQRLLIYRYICGCTWERVAVKMSYNYVYIIRKLHPRALDQIENLLKKSYKKQ